MLRCLLHARGSAVSLHFLCAQGFVTVLPVVDRLQKEGYRIWYEEGIAPGSSWDVYITEHIEGCDYFIAFLSGKYLDTLDYVDELNFCVIPISHPRQLKYR